MVKNHLLETLIKGNNMNIWDAIKGRRSIRSYKDESVSKELISKILEAAQHAPSSKNSQPWKFLVIRNAEILEKLAKIHPWAWALKKAPVGIVCLGEEEKSQHHYPMDVSCAIQNIMLAAHALGLGTCWIAIFSMIEDELEINTRKILEIPEEYRVIAILPLGFPAKPAKTKPLKSLEEIVHYDKFLPFSK